MDRDEENLTPDEKARRVANEQAVAKLVTASETASKMLEIAAEKALKVVEKAAANGLATRADTKRDRNSINLTTVASMVGAVATIFVVVHFVIDPVKTKQDEQGVVLVGVVEKQSKFSDQLGTQQVAIKEVVLDVHELYRVSNTAHSDRLSKPVVPTALDESRESTH